jgi:hypothetical protein
VFGPQEADPVAALRAFLGSLGVPGDCAAHGVPPDAYAEILRGAAAGARGRNFIRPSP